MQNSFGSHIPSLLIPLSPGCCARYRVLIVFLVGVGARERAHVRALYRDLWFFAACTAEAARTFCFAFNGGGFVREFEYARMEIAARHV